MNIEDLNGRLVLATNLSTKQDLLANAYDNPNNFFKTGITINNNLSLSGGDENSKFFIPIGNSKANGIIPNNELPKLQ